MLKVITYEEQQSDHASGSLTAPFAGIHTIHSAAFFASAEELRPQYDP